MRNTASRALLRQGLARPELRRVQDVIRPLSVVANGSTRPPCLQPSPPYTPLLAVGSTRAFHAAAPAAAKARQPEWREQKNKVRQERSKRQEATAAARGDEDGDGEGPKHPAANPEEPLDFADVNSRLKRHDERFREALKKMRAGGRFNPDVIGALRVQPDRKGGETYPLREVAQVVPRGGRAISLIAHEEAYVKPIMSAVQASADFNQQPQRDPDNELELVLKIEPEKRDEALKRAKAMCHEWRDRVRSVRQKRDKHHATWRKEGLIGPDLKRTADKELEKIIKAKMAEIDEAEKEATKSVESK
ncbi:ribosome recycling factor [Hypomontagnella monticulosa]|nr:ribosome recycling factor [Hypomontagnella monticulosa]